MATKSLISLLVMSLSLKAFSSVIYESDFAVDSVNNVYLINKNNYVIEKLDSNNNNPSPQYHTEIFNSFTNFVKGTFFISVDSHDQLFLAVNNVIKKYNHDGFLLGSYSILEANGGMISEINATVDNHVLIKLPYNYYNLGSLDDPDKYEKIPLYGDSPLTLNRKGQAFKIAFVKSRKFGFYGWFHLIAQNLNGEEILNYRYTPELENSCTPLVLGVNDKNEILRTRYQEGCRHSSIERCDDSQYCKSIKLQGLDEYEERYQPSFVKSIVKNKRIYQLFKNNKTETLVLFIHLEEGTLLNLYEFN